MDTRTMESRPSAMLPHRSGRDGSLGFGRAAFRSEGDTIQPRHAAGAVPFTLVRTISRRWPW